MKLLNAVQVAALNKTLTHDGSPRHITRLPIQTGEKLANVVQQGVDPEIDAWVAEGRPRIWCIVESTIFVGGGETYHAAVDFGYGRMALFHGDKLVQETASDVIVYRFGKASVVMVNQDYYGAPGYLYVRHPSGK